MTRLEPELGIHYIGLKSRICPRCGGYIVGSRGCISIMATVIFALCVIDNLAKFLNR